MGSADPSRPRIGVDYWPAVTRTGGVGRYSRELVRALVRLEERPELRLFEVGPGRRSVPEELLGLARVTPGLARRRLRMPRTLLALAHRTAGIGAERWLGGLDLFHRVFADQPPVDAVPQVLALSEFPTEGSRAERALRRALGGPLDLLVMSASAAERARERWNLPAERVHAVPVGCEHWRRELATLPPRADPPLLLALGALRPGRHPLALLAAFEELRAREGPRDTRRDAGAQLCFAGAAVDSTLGSAAAIERRLRESPFARDIRWIPRPREAELPSLVACASVLVHLSDEEWTAVTPLEAFSTGTAVVASPLEAFREALGSEATFVASTEPGPLADALEAALADRSEPLARERRLARAARFTWEANARATLEVWRAVLARIGKS
jgi:glycosyltransferase involved in cell wall biosynthesis